MILEQPLTFLFGAGVQLRNRLYDSGSLSARELDGPVVSVGNISVGGAGKTPFTILLGQLLQSRGIAFDILSRGYGRSTTGVVVVDPSGSPRQFGDEPLLMARKLGVPVVVGEDRYGAGMLAEKKHGLRLHLLDDGFQHRRLKRQFDIALVTPEDFDDRLLPAGRLREPLAALLRADVTVLMGANPESLPKGLKLTWRVQRGIGKVEISRRPVVFCGIARPQRLLTQLRAAGVEPVAVEIYRDHHAYSEDDVRHLLRVGDRNQADGYVTTEKDGVNLGRLAEQFQNLAVVSVELIWENAEACLDFMLQTLKARGKPAA